MPTDAPTSDADTPATAETPPSIVLGEPVLRWSARAHSISEIETELTKIWAAQDLTVETDGEKTRHVAARTSVMNLVVVARRPELAERCAATIQMLTGRHPSRTIVIQSADPDGPSWLDGRIEAHCIMPREDAAEICAETIHLICGGEAGRHLSAIATPLIIHDLPVTVWWPGEPPLSTAAARDLLADADRLVVDGSTWSGDGLDRLRELAEHARRDAARRSPTSRWPASPAGARRSRRSSTIPTSCRTSGPCAGSRSPTRRTTRAALPVRPTWSSRSITSAGWRRVSGSRWSRRSPRSPGRRDPRAADGSGPARSSRPSGAGSPPP